jgi:hypothetical protein
MKFVDGFIIIGCVIFLIGIVLNDYVNSLQNVDFGFYLFTIVLIIIGLVTIGVFTVCKMFYSKRTDGIWLCSIPSFQCKILNKCGHSISFQLQISIRFNDFSKNLMVPFCRLAILLWTMILKIRLRKDSCIGNRSSCHHLLWHHLDLGWRQSRLWISSMLGIFAHDPIIGNF